MSLSRLLWIAAVIAGGSISALAQPSPEPSPPAGATPPSQTASSSPSPSPATPWPGNSLAPFKVRLQNASSVKVMTTLLGLNLGMPLKQAHAKLDKLSDPAHPPKEEREAEEGEWKVLWQLAGGDYASVFIKTDEEKHIQSMTGILRPGKEIPFEKIGEIKKSPFQDANTIVWDVLRPKKPLFRVTARGLNRKANTITIFVVERPEAGGPKRD